MAYVTAMHMRVDTTNPCVELSINEHVGMCVNRHHPSPVLIANYIVMAYSDGLHSDSLYNYDPYSYGPYTPARYKRRSNIRAASVLQPHLMQSLADVAPHRPKTTSDGCRTVTALILLLSLYRTGF